MNAQDFAKGAYEHYCERMRFYKDGHPLPHWGQLSHEEQASWLAASQFIVSKYQQATSPG